MPAPSKLKDSPVIKHRSVAKKDPKTDKLYTVSVILRENGRFEVYSDFMLVYEFYDVKQQCVDIQTDFSKFYLKFVEDAD